MAKARTAVQNTIQTASSKIDDINGVTFMYVVNTIKIVNKKQDKTMIIEKAHIKQFDDVRLFYHSFIDGMQNRKSKSDTTRCS